MHVPWVTAMSAPLSLFLSLSLSLSFFWLPGVSVGGTCGQGVHYDLRPTRDARALGTRYAPLPASLTDSLVA
ncbi:hypothetical protein T492DRAFT_994839 [Pavlovales sp. CCMP2436]|nr:hypothetical protein T492DRAFT_994839 [Pavlovales sp. CCMP2436]